MWVKNAYDVDATRVLVRFCMPSEADKGSIEIIDNGHGMSLETIQTVWMEPATLFRKRQDRSEKYGRRVLGEKGVGRFAFSRLGDFLEVVTRRTEMEYEVRAYFDWKQFDDENKYQGEREEGEGRGGEGGEGRGEGEGGREEKGGGEGGGERKEGK